MKIDIYGSGSSGNAYLVSDSKTSLLIECGIPFKKIQEKSNFTINQVEGCLCSHAHADHAKACCDVMKRGIDIYTSNGTIKALGLSGHRVQPIESMKQFSCGTFAIMPFDVEHDADEPLGFLIQSSHTGEKLLYFTDTCYLKYKFEGVTHMMAEANYSIGILNKNAETDPSAAALKNRIIQTHMSIENLVVMLKENDLSKLQQIYLIHMSESNADPEEFKKTIQQLTGAEVYAAQKEGLCQSK
ncbi:MAG TPA: MBL fold metallo-hydrolase [Candidatus Omnitrophota bacterium]|nr:MBL fold metallo-hydrolase [Candidatus Omnitrophota bacterium]